MGLCHVCLRSSSHGLRSITSLSLLLCRRGHGCPGKNPRIRPSSFPDAPIASWLPSFFEFTADSESPPALVVLKLKIQSRIQSRWVLSSSGPKSPPGVIGGMRQSPLAWRRQIAKTQNSVGLISLLQRRWAEADCKARVHCGVHVGRCRSLGGRILQVRVRLGCVVSSTSC